MDRTFTTEYGNLKNVDAGTDLKDMVERMRKELFEMTIEFDGETKFAPKLAMFLSIIKQEIDNPPASSRLSGEALADLRSSYGDCLQNSTSEPSTPLELIHMVYGVRAFWETATRTLAYASPEVSRRGLDLYYLMEIAWRALDRQCESARELCESVVRAQNEADGSLDGVTADLAFQYFMQKEF